MTKYKTAKSQLRAYAEYVSVQHRGDKPAIRQAINDYTDLICRDYNLNEYQGNLLHHYACKLHPKD
jgi:hypothetical protein